MPTTSNFGWTTPADTDLVKDGAAAIRTLGNGIDTSFLDLKGGTTGQVLAKASNTDLDFTWTAGGDITEVQGGTGISVASGTGPIPVVTNTVATAYDAKGDLVVGTGADTFAKLTVGTNDFVLTAASGETTGLKWAAAPSPTQTFTLINSGGTSLTGSSVTINVSGKNQLFIFFTGASSTSGSDMYFRFNADSGNNYNNRGYGVSDSNTLSVQNQTNASTFYLGYTTTDGGTIDGTLLVQGANATAIKPITYFANGSSAPQSRFGQGWYAGTSAITSVTFHSAGSNFDAGTIYVYGA